MHTLTIIHEMLHNKYFDFFAPVISGIYCAGIQPTAMWLTVG